MKKNGITLYLILVFGLTFTAEAILLPLGLLVWSDPGSVSYILWTVIFFIPALSAWIATAIAPPHERLLPKVWPLPAGPTIRIALGVPIIFTIIHGVAAIFRFTRPQWNLGPLMQQLEQAQTLSEGMRATMAPFLLVFGTIVTILLGCTVFAVLALGSEMGWRGYLLPRLLPGGRWRAELLTGLLWSVWFFPVLFWLNRSGELSGSAVGFAVRALLLFVALSIILGEIIRRHSHLGLAAVFLGSVFAQSEGMWRYLFPIGSPPWTGVFGLISIVVWAIVALAPGLLLGRGNLPAAPAAPAAERRAGADRSTLE
ncbi:MAG: hypothetical protein IT368_05280 [Candidatus Hydrogenedentes bacterium]|nr:hypothetical protein [Candidatus Hydrogenedentota bacterium]